MSIQAPRTRLLNPATAPEEARRYYELVDRLNEEAAKKSGNSDG